MRTSNIAGKKTPSLEIYHRSNQECHIPQTAAAKSTWYASMLCVPTANHLDKPKEIKDTFY